MTGDWVAFDSALPLNLATIFIPGEIRDPSEPHLFVSQKFSLSHYNEKLNITKFVAGLTLKESVTSERKLLFPLLFYGFPILFQTILYRSISHNIKYLTV